MLKESDKINEKIKDRPGNNKVNEVAEFNRIYESYEKEVLREAYLYSGNYYTAQDITQNVFFQLYKKLDDISLSNIKGWLFKVAKNNAINYYRKAAHEILQEELSDDMFLALQIQTPEDIALSIRKNFESVKLLKRIKDALIKKNDRWYKAVFMSYYLKIPQDIVAKRMNIGTDTLYSLLHRAKCWMKAEFGSVYEELL